MAFNQRGHELSILLSNIGPGAVDILRMGIEMGIRLSLETYGESSATAASRQARVYLLTRGAKPAAMFRFPAPIKARHLSPRIGGCLRIHPSRYRVHYRRPRSRSELHRVGATEPLQPALRERRRNGRVGARSPLQRRDDSLACVRCAIDMLPSEPYRKSMKASGVFLIEVASRDSLTAMIVSFLEAIPGLSTWVADHDMPLPHGSYRCYRLLDDTGSATLTAADLIRCAEDRVVVLDTQEPVSKNALEAFEGLCKDRLVTLILLSPAPKVSP